MDTISTLTARDGGGTFDAVTLRPYSPRQGYAVGLADGTAAQLPLADVARLAVAVRKVAARFRCAYVGTWIKDDVVHVDPVAVVPNLAAALYLARQTH